MTFVPWTETSTFLSHAVPTQPTTSSFAVLPPVTAALPPWKACETALDSALVGTRAVERTPFWSWTVTLTRLPDPAGSLTAKVVPVAADGDATTAGGPEAMLADGELEAGGLDPHAATTSAASPMSTTNGRMPVLLQSARGRRRRPSATPTITVPSSQRAERSC